MTWVAWKICPFCKGDSKTARRFETYWAIVCDICLCQGPRGKTIDEAIHNWNRRVYE